MRFRIFVAFLIPVFFLAGCFGSRQISSENLSSIYHAGTHVLHAEFSVFHFSADSSRLFAKINTDDFLKIRQPEDGFKASFRLICRLVESYESSVLLDSTRSDFIVDPTDGLAKIRLYTVDFRIPKQGSFLLSCTVVDLNKKVSEEYFINIDHETNQSRQSFFVSTKNNLPVFRNYFSPADTFKISYRDPSVQKLFVQYYHRDFPLASPPFSFDTHESFDYIPDSTFTLNTKDSSALNFPGEGFYHFQVDTSIKDGLTIFRFKGGFPAVTTPDQMIDAVRYLTSKKEFEELNSGETKKASVDKFWIEIGRTPERTRPLIKKYYSRVQDANRWFSSHTEGWRTDRGMIYIIFGSPNFVYKNSVSENWIYGQPNNALSLNFFFTKVNNPFTDNDYTLSRAPIYDSNWYRAVDYWREGRVYNDF
jgi:GWxTD domain-containing protein